MIFMKTLNHKFKLIAVIALVVAAGASMRTRAQDQTPPPSPDRHALFGQIGITRGQTARLNVSNLPLPVNDLPPGPIRVELSFVDADGNTLINTDGQPIRRVVMLEPGHSTFLQINANNLLGRDEIRLNFRPVVKLTPPDGTRSLPPGPTTLEVIENTSGKTGLLYPGVIRGFNPQPDPPRE
jgi:hypothetical protein